jgi:hypothetical protein
MAAAADTTAIPRAELEELVGRYFDAWDERDADAIAEHHSPTASSTSMPPATR